MRNANTSPAQSPSAIGRAATRAGLALSLLLLGGCMAVPLTDDMAVRKCDTNTRPKRIEIVNVGTESNSDSIESMLLSPLTVAGSALVTGPYVAASNLYYAAETHYKCKG